MIFPMFGKGSSDRSRGPEERTQGERLFPHAGYAHLRGLSVRLAAELPHLNRSLRSLFPSEIIYRFAFSFDHRGLVFAAPFGHCFAYAKPLSTSSRVSGWRALGHAPSGSCNLAHNVLKYRPLQLSFPYPRVRF